MRNKRPNNKASDLERQNRQYNQEFAKVNATLRNQNPYDQEFAVESENETLRNTRNANTKGYRQRDVMNVELANDNEFKLLKRNKNNVEFANEDNFEDCDNCCENCKEDQCDCE